MKRFALIGEKLGHSLSAPIHNRYFDIAEMDARYELLAIARGSFDREFEAILNAGYDGINVTIPYKLSVMEHLHEIAPEAKEIGAVNTIAFENGRRIGYNTDFYGLLATFERFGISVLGKRVVILGTGGASRAVWAVCRHLGAADILFVSREKTEHLGCAAKRYDAYLSGDLLINATPCGMYPNQNACPIAGELHFLQVMDLIYNPRQTLLLKQAALQGLTAVNGLYMLVAQGIRSQAIWNKTETDRQAIEKIYHEVNEQ